MEAVRVTSSGVVKSDQRILCGFTLTGPNASTLKIYNDDSADNSKLVASVSSPANETVAVTGLSVTCDNGVYAAVTGTSAEAVLYLD